MKDFLFQNRIFLSLYATFLVVGALLIYHLENGNEILYFNSLHSPFSDRLFSWITRLAEAPVLLLIIIFAIRFGYKKGIAAGLNVICVFAVIQVFKQLIFAGAARPATFFEGKEHLNFVQGVEVYRYNSFPSGHTATAFALFFMFSIMINDKRWSYLFFLLALLVGISRVYLLEHFFRDVYFGSLLGMCVTALFYLTFVRSDFYARLPRKDKAPK